VQVVIFDLVSIRAHEQAGKARVIAQVGDQRSPLYPNIPLLSETLNPALATDFWMGMAAPAGTPPAVVALLNKEINAIINTPEFKAKGDTVSMYPQHKSAAEFSDRLAMEWKKWGDVIHGRKLLVH
jgi:tripartite-type tricarboxylate transporter receptor subunit TctC